MKELANRALNLAHTKGATYADIRVLYMETQSLQVKNGVVEAISLGNTQGFGVRVMADGSWGFASSARLEKGTVDHVVALAIDRANPTVLFAGVAGGAVYRSASAGKSWTQSSAGLDPNANLRSIVVDPTNSQIVYATDLFSGVHVSRDGGATWRALNTGLSQRAANVLAVSDDGAVLYLGVEGGGVWRLGTM